LTTGSATPWSTYSTVCGCTSSEISLLSNMRSRVSGCRDSGTLSQLCCMKRDNIIEWGFLINKQKSKSTLSQNQ